MKLLLKFKLLLIFQLGLSFIAGLFISKMSFIGQVGISLVHKEYKVFQSFWKTALLFFCLQLLVIGMQYLVYEFLSKRALFRSSTLWIFFAVIGLLMTIYDFTSQYSHRILNGYFHSGFYLFWLGIILTSLYFLFNKKKLQID